MTIEIGFLLALLAGMVYLFLTEKLPVDLTAFAGLVILTLTGYLTADEAFTGFASSAVITMLSIFIVSAALLHTGLADMVGSRLHRWVGNREVPLIITLMLIAGVLSAFMNNIAATAVLMPAVAALARQAKIPPSRLFMPLAFGAILGGTTTLVGTPPNILAAEMLRERGLEPFELFDFTPIGLAILAIGVLFMTTLGRRLLPTRETHGPALSEAGDLAQVYQLDQELFTLRIPESSPLNGLTLGEAKLGTALGTQVVAIERRGKRRPAPAADTLLRGGDSLFIQGRIADLEEMLRLKNLRVSKATTADIPLPRGGIGGAQLALSAGSSFVGKTLRELDFRKRCGLVVLAIERGDELLLRQVGSEVLAAGDHLLALGHRRDLEALSESRDLEVLALGFKALSPMRDELFQIAIPEGSALAGMTLAGSRLGELSGPAVAGIIRGEEILLIVSPDEVLRAGDRLLLTGKPSRIVSLVELGDVELEEGVGSAEPAVFESDEVAVVEASVAPRSAAIGQSLGDLRFRDRYGLQVLALWRRGEPVHHRLARLALEVGDALLLQGPREKIGQLAAESDFVVLSARHEVPRRTRKAPFALGGLLLMVAMVMAGFQPIHVAAFTAATVVVLLGAVTMEEAYRAIEWRAIFLVAAVLPVGVAMERTGAAQLIADQVGELAGPWGPYAVLGALVVLSSILSQGLDGAPAVVLLTPVVLQTAEGMGVSPYPFMMGASLAASAAFMTPFSHKANLLVMGAGGYRSMDYLKVGTPLTIVLLAVMTAMIPLFFPF
ncbi:MAG: SLC13 family permease [Acidobacteriota bacterium]